MTAPLHPDLIDAQRLPALPSVLKALRSLTHMRFAALVRVTDREWRACLVDDAGNFGIDSGDVWPIEHTFCGQVREINAPVTHLSISPDSAGGVATHMALALGVRCHFAYPVFKADGTFFGTLCVMDTKPHESLPSGVVDAASAFSQLLGAQLGEGQAAPEYVPPVSPKPPLSSVPPGETATPAHAPVAAPKSASSEPVVQAKVLSVLGHDLRNPMHSLMAAIEMIQLKPMEPRVERLMGMVEGSALRLSELARQTLDFARLQMLGNLAVQVVPSHDPVAGIQAVIKGVRAAYPQREVVQDIDGCPATDMDPARIEQALAIVLTHAVKHCGADRQVEVTAHGGDESLVIDVDVPDYILDAALLPHVFDPFYEIGGAAQTAHLGVGLYIARATLLAHGGDLTATQNADDVRFSFSLPVTSTIASA